MKAIVDCNSFYCGCERLFKPDLNHKPVIVLSNNDGCIISRTDEAKRLGVEMAGPYFKAKPLIEKFNIATFSSNYHLYGDLSWRVMETMRMLMGKNNVEVYSVDEAFVDLPEFNTEKINIASENLKTTIEQWTGIRVSIGVAPTKVLAKVANRLAKKNKQATNCIVILNTEESIADALYNTPIGDVWGIGRQYAEKLKEEFAVFTALDLRNKTEYWAKKNLGGVTGVRLIKELNGEAVIVMKDELTEKKMIATTRMFGSAVNNLKDIQEAIATYTSRAAEKLRRQNSAAGIISVFVVQKEKKFNETFRHGMSRSAYTILPIATSATNELIKAALPLIEKIFTNGEFYKKAGVMLSGIVPDINIQGNLFNPKDNDYKQLMMMVDNVNFSMRDDVLKFASGGTKKNWKMRQELRSPRYTTRWDEIKTVS